MASIPAILLSLLLAVELARPRSRPRAEGWCWVPAAVAAGLVVVSSAMAFQPLRSFRVLVMWLAACLVFLGARSAARGPAGRLILGSVLLVAALQSGLGQWQATVSFPGAAEAAPGTQTAAPAPEGDEAARIAAVQARIRSGRAVGLLGLPALLASLAILALPSAVAGALAGRRGPTRWLHGTACLLLAGGLAASRSLGGVAALALAAAVGSTLWLGLSRGRRRALAVAVLLVAAVVAIPRLAPGDEASAGRALRLRAANWLASLSMMAAHPAVGVGPGNYGVAYPAHRIPGSNETQHAHSSYLELISDAGPAAIFLVVTLVAGLWRIASRASTAGAPGGPELWMSRALAVGVLAWAAQNAVDYSAYVWGSLLPFAAAAGCLASRAGPSSRGRPWGPVAACVVVAAAAAAAAFALPDALSRWRLEMAAQAARSGRGEEALELARSSVAWNPWEAESRVALAHALLDRAESLRRDPAARSRAVAQALEEADEAVRLDPVTANRRMTLSRARAAAGDGAGAYAAMAAAARLNPFKPRYAAWREELESQLLGAEPAP